MKRKIRLTESNLHRIVNRSVKKVLKENNNQNEQIINYIYNIYDYAEQAFKLAQNGGLTEKDSYRIIVNNIKSIKQIVDYLL